MDALMIAGIATAALGAVGTGMGLLIHPATTPFAPRDDLPGQGRAYPDPDDALIGRLIARLENRSDNSFKRKSWMTDAAMQEMPIIGGHNTRMSHTSGRTYGPKAVALQRLADMRVRFAAAGLNIDVRAAHNLYFHENGWSGGASHNGSWNVKLNWDCYATRESLMARRVFVPKARVRDFNVIGAHALTDRLRSNDLYLSFSNVEDGIRHLYHWLLNLGSYRGAQQALQDGGRRGLLEFERIIGHAGYSPAGAMVRVTRAGAYWSTAEGICQEGWRR